MERIAIVDGCKINSRSKVDTTDIKFKKVTESICESHHTDTGILINIVTKDSHGYFYLYDCIPAIPKKVSKADSPSRLKGRRI